MSKFQFIKSWVRSPLLLWSSLLVLLLCAVYSFTLLPGIGYQGDTAKFQFVGKVLGIPQPTGYPTYIFLNKEIHTIRIADHSHGCGTHSGF